MRTQRLVTRTAIESNASNASNYTNTIIVTLLQSYNVRSTTHRKFATYTCGVHLKDGLLKLLKVRRSPAEGVNWTSASFCKR